MRFKFSYICLPSFAKQHQIAKFKVELERHAYQIGSWVASRFCSSWMGWNTSCLVQPWFVLCQTRKTSPADKQLFTEARNRYNRMVESEQSDYYKTKIEQAGTIQVFNLLRTCSLQDLRFCRLFFLGGGGGAGGGLMTRYISWLKISMTITFKGYRIVLFGTN